MTITMLHRRKQKILGLKKLVYLLALYNLLYTTAYNIVSVCYLVNKKTNNHILIYGDVHAKHDNSDDGINLLLKSMQKFNNKRIKALQETPLTCGIELPLEEPGGIWGATFTKLAPYVYKRKSLPGFLFSPWEVRSPSINSVLFYTFLTLQDVSLTHVNAHPKKYAALAMKKLKKTVEVEELPKISINDFINYLNACDEQITRGKDELKKVVSLEPLAPLYEKYRNASYVIKHEVFAASSGKDSLQDGIVLYLSRHKQPITEKCIYELCLLFCDKAHSTFADINFLHRIVKDQHKAKRGNLTLCIVGERHTQQISSVLQHLGYSLRKQQWWYPDILSTLTPETSNGLQRGRLNKLISSALLTAQKASIKTCPTPRTRDRCAPYHKAIKPSRRLRNKQ